MHLPQELFLDRSVTWQSLAGHHHFAHGWRSLPKFWLFFTFQGNFDNDQSLADLAIFPDCISEGKMILAKLDIKKTRCWQEDTMRIIPGTFLMLLLVCPKHCNWKLFGLTRQDRVCLNDRPVVSPCLDQDKSELWKSEIFNKLTLPHLKQSYFINEH